MRLFFLLTPDFGPVSEYQVTCGKIIADYISLTAVFLWKTVFKGKSVALEILVRKLLYFLMQHLFQL